jgi:hypothetical protein
MHCRCIENQDIVAIGLAALPVHRNLQFTFAIRHFKTLWGKGLYGKSAAGTINSCSGNDEELLLFSYSNRHKRHNPRPLLKKRNPI